jgi:hypothetical protein
MIETKPLRLTLKVPDRQALLQVLPSRSLYKKRCPSPKLFLLAESLIDKPFLMFSQTGASIRRDARP